MQNKFLAPEYDDWFADLYDPVYPELHDETKGPYRPLQWLIDSFSELSRKKNSEITILDPACGTGNNYMAFSRHGYNIWATDGSRKMLEHAALNCDKNEIPKSQLICEPITWTDSDAYQRYLIEKGLSFDLIVVISNSLCHIPAVPGYLDVALNNFRRMLKPGGRLIIDTKRFIETDKIAVVPSLRELRHTGKEWIVRTEKEDGPHLIQGLGNASIHTQMRYDVEPDFKVCRAHVEVTISGDNFSPLIRHLHYYPLPVSILKNWLDASGGFETEYFEAKTLPLDWSYDVLVARKSPWVLGLAGAGGLVLSD